MNPRINYTLWTIVICAEGIMLILATYIFASISFNFINLYRHRRKNTQSWFVGHSPLCLNALLLLFCVTCILRCALALFVFFLPITGLMSDMTYGQCKIIEQLYQTINGIGTAFLYLFLWLRQFSLYNKNHLSRFASTRFLRFNWFILFLILAGFVAGIITSVLLLKQENFGVVNSTNACFYTVTANADYVLLYVVDAVSVFLQVSVIGMFIHILRKHQREIRHFSGQPTRSSLLVNRLVRYSTLSAIICIVTDIVTTIEDIMLRQRTVQLVLHFIWDVDSMINLVSIIFCLLHWKALLFPWYKPVNKNSSNENSSTNSATPVTVTQKTHV